MAKHGVGFHVRKNRFRILIGIGVAAVLAVAGCLMDFGGDRVCTELFAYGLTVRVTDSATGGALDGVTVSATDSAGEAQEPFETGGDAGTYIGLGEKIGSYQVDVSKSGYTSQTFSIELESDGCHVVSQERDIALVPEAK